MTRPGSINPAVYRELRDVLRRQPEITETWYEPDAVQRQFLVASVDPARTDPPTGPEAPTIEVRWRGAGERAFFRIDYADPNTDVHCGFHRDGDHPELGRVHVQYVTPAMEAPTYEPFDRPTQSPPKTLSHCLDRLFTVHIPRLSAE